MYKTRATSALAALLAAAVLSFGASPAAAQGKVLPFPYDEGDPPPNPIGKIITYPFSRIADAFDVISVNLGFGFGLHVNFHATRLFQFGIGASTTSEIGSSGAPREWGVFQETRSEFSLLLLNVETFNQSGSIGTVKDFSTATQYDRFFLVKRDSTGIGLDVTAGIISLGLEFHPMEALDFFAGLFFLDLKGDDI